MMMLSGNLNKLCVVYAYLTKLHSLSETQTPSLHNENNIYCIVSEEEKNKQPIYSTSL